MPSTSAGPRITLLEMDMAALLADEAKLKALQGKIGPDASFSEVKPYLKDIKGIKIDGPSITVEFVGEGLGLEDPRSLREAQQSAVGRADHDSTTGEGGRRA